LPKTAVGKVFKPDLRRRAITRVLDAEFAEKKLAARVVDVVEEKKRGLVARIDRKGEIDQAGVRAVMDTYTIPWDWA
jgi:fatty-acyl-CoA synthase